MVKSDNQKNFNQYQKLITEDTPEECQSCGGTLVLEKINLEDYQGGKLYMMEQVPGYVCQDCSEVWVPGPVVAEFEQMIAAAKRPKEQRHEK